MLLLFFLFQLGQANYPDQPERVIPLRGIESPTAITRHQGTWYLLADLDNLYQGLYRLEPDGDIWRASLAKMLPLQQLVGFAAAPSNGLLVLSSLQFDGGTLQSPAKVIELVPPNWDIKSETPILFDAICPNRLPDCGLVGFWRDAAGAAFAVKRSGLPAIYPLLLGAGGLIPQPETLLTVNRQAGEIAGIQVRDGYLFAWFQSLWRLGSLPLSQLEIGKGTAISLRELGHFPSAAKEFQMDQANLNAEGLAIGFHVDADARLYLLLNNRGFSYVSPAWREKGNPPLLLIYPAKP